MKADVRRNDESGMIELGVRDGGHFVALATMPATQFDATVENLKTQAVESDKDGS